MSADRPSPDVIDALAKLAKFSTESLQVIVEESPIPVVSAAGTRWMEALQAQYARLLVHAPNIDAGMLWDDDALFSTSALRRLRGHLQFLEHDRVEVESLFLWNHPDRVNRAFPAHWSAALFRRYPGDEFPTNFVTHCPRHCARSERVARLSEPCLNYGYMDQSDRELTWEAQKAAGKIDGHTLCLVRKPDLQELKNGHQS